MRKLLCALVLLTLLAGCASASGVRIGVLSALNLTEEEINSAIVGSWKWSVLFEGHGVDDRYIFYDSLTSMLLALDKGEIDEIEIPDIQAEYIMNNRADIKVSCVTKSISDYSFGFIERNDALRQRFNDAIKTLEANGTLDALRTKYLSSTGQAIDAVKFDVFNDAETIRVAVTGDLPPIDYIDEDGRPAGYNTALLSEIGRLLNVNITTLNIDSGARAAALTSGRADVVFWIEVPEEFNLDIPEGVITSRPYYRTEYFLQLRKK